MIPLAIPAALVRYSGLLKVAGIVAAVLAAWWWWNGNNAGQQKIGYDRAAAEYQTKLNEQKDAARLREHGWFLNSERASNERTELENRLALSRASAAAADDRLRRETDAFGKRLSVATVEACRTAAETAAGLLGECSREYRQVAAAADGHAADVQQCEAAWPE